MLNTGMGKHLGLRLEPYGWEQQGPGQGRAQDIMNKELDASELFIGVLWRRWGTATGDYTSGFEEEYERAKARLAAHGSEPEIWLYFKAVDEASKGDAGPELKKVLDFRDLVGKEALYQVLRRHG